MRFAPLMIVALAAMVATSVQAKNYVAGSPIFGKKGCEPSFPCSDISNSDTARVAVDKIIGIASRCVSKMGIGPGSGGYFESSFGLDSSLCLTTSDMPAAATGLTMIPRCCVTPTDSSGSVCKVVCTRYGVR